VAANIAGKSAQLFRRLNTTVLGVVENMATFVCPNCGEEARVFAGTSGEELARSLGTPYLGSIPLDPAVSEAADRGLPSLIACPERPQGASFLRIAGAVAAQVSIVSASRPLEPAAV
jgi:ATP-binding protein involved in chromosome partitioning